MKIHNLEMRIRWKVELEVFQFMFTFIRKLIYSITLSLLSNNYDHHMHTIQMHTYFNYLTMNKAS